MYVCMCNALTDTDVKRAAASSAATRPSQVFAACNTRPQCGTCTRSICALIGLCAESPFETAART